MKHNLDFIIIGAQKSGTTTLFKLLNQHKKIFVPSDKEAPFFGTKKESTGWHQYIKDYFESDPQSAGKLWGTATPQYMSSEKFAEKIYAVNPQVKLIAILRQPLDRAFSHYRMSKKRGRDIRSFNEALAELLQPQNLSSTREKPTSTNAYIVWGEYGRILKSYLQFFSRQQIFICFMNELEKNPQELINKLTAFLNIEMFVPGGLEKKYHQGGSARKLKFLGKKKSAFKTFMKNTVIKIISKRNYIKWRYWIDQWNTKQTNEEANISQENLNKLIKLYEADAKILYNDFGIIIPWEGLFKKNELKKQL